MKVSKGQEVIVLDTTHKPAGSGIVQEYHAETHQYTILYKYPGSVIAEKISIPEERLLMK